MYAGRCTSWSWNLHEFAALGSSNTIVNFYDDAREPFNASGASRLRL